ncbi:hypothetical protein [Nonomuraea dietziae]|uniref:hypothetical protein n=1 Tax=Nonomuraea dietziae TaxID=65515 RepID=UPI00340FC78B
MRTRLVLASLPLLLLTACGSAPTTTEVASADGTAKSGSAKPSPSATVDRAEAQLKFAQCMRENGVDMADPDPNGGIRIEAKKDGADQGLMDKAMKACKEHLDGAIGDKAAQDPKRRDQMLKFAQCMREHGVDMPDPSADGMVKMTMPKGSSEATVKAAQEACKELAPGMAGGGS